MKKFTKESYCDVRGWDEELIKKAAEMMAEDLGIPRVKDLKIIITSQGIFCQSSTDLGFGSGKFYPPDRPVKENKVTKEEAEQMIKEREEGQPVNTLAKLHKAQEDLLQAEVDYTNASEALDTAEKAHTEALEAFSKEAVGLLGESFKTSSARSQEDMSNPLNWKEGDLIECINTDVHCNGRAREAWAAGTVGNTYQLQADGIDRDEDVDIVDDNGGQGCPSYKCFKWHSRPQ